MGLISKEIAHPMHQRDAMSNGRDEKRRGSHCKVVKNIFSWTSIGFKAMKVILYIIILKNINSPTKVLLSLRNSSINSVNFVNLVLDCLQNVNNHKYLTGDQKYVHE